MPLFGKDYKKLYIEECKKNDKLKNENKYNNGRMNSITNEKIALNNDLIRLKQNYKEIELKLKDAKSINTLMSLKKIRKMNIHHPLFQRAVVQSRVDELYKSISKKPVFIIPLYIGKIKKDYFIIDGQHRLAALEKFEKFEDINVKIIDVKDYNELKEYFFLINDSLRLPDIYKNPEPKHIQIIKETFLYFQQHYPLYFTTKRVSKPNFGVTGFHNILENSNIIEEKNITKSEQLINMIEKLNKKYEKEYINQTNYRGLTGLKTIHKRNKKCRGLYLRVNQRWLEHLKQENFNPNKKEISQKMRDFIWNINYGNKNTASCICCDKTKIRNDYFEAGHIIAEHYGGDVNQYNLKPICGKCNKSMGTIEMFEYMLKNKVNKELALNMKNLYLSNTYLFKKS